MKSFDLLLRATTQNLKTMGSVTITLQTSTTADTIIKHKEKTIANHKYLQQKAVY